METSEDAAQALLEVKDIANHHLGHMEFLQQQYEDGDNEALASSMLSAIGSANEAKKIDPNIDLGTHSFDLEQVDENDLVKYYNPEMMGQIAEQTQHLVNILDDANLDLLASFSRNLKINKDNFSFKSDATGASFNPHRSSSASSMFKNMQKSNLGRFKVPHFLKNKVGSSLKKEERRRLLQQSTQCQAKCNPNSPSFWRCKCELLIDYASNITPYDLAVMFSQGYIDQSEDSDGFATFTLNPNLYDAGDSLPSKVNTIQTLASDLSISLDQQKCSDLLQQFHTAKGLNESRQLNVDEIGGAVGTPIKLKLSEITLAYDGLEQLSSGPFADGGEVDQEMTTGDYVPGASSTTGWYTSQTYFEGSFPGEGNLPEGVYKFKSKSEVDNGNGDPLENENPLYISAGTVSYCCFASMYV